MKPEKRASGHARRAARPLLLIALLLAATEAAAASRAVPEEVPALQEKRYALRYDLDFDEGRLTSTTRLTLSNAGTRPVREVPLLLHRLLTVEEVRSAGGGSLPFTQRVVAFSDEPRRQVNAIRVTLARPVAPGASVEIALRFSGYLAGYVETGSRYVQDRIDPAFTILRLDALAYPVVGYPSDRSRRLQGFASFDYEATIEVPDSLQVANGGRLVERRAAGGRATYVYRNLQPCWRMDFAIARYQVLGGDTASVFCFPQDSANAARVQQGVLRSMRLFSGWFGPPRESPRFAVIEIPDGWGSQKDVTSILQTAAAFQDPRRLYEVYHEVSHMWWATSRDSFPPRMEEGLASYLEDWAAERLEGGERVRRTHASMISWLRGLLEKQPRYRDLAMKDYGARGETDLSYSVGFLMFEALHALVGDQAFGEIVGGFHQRYHASGATTAQFLAHARERSPADLERFFQDWYFTTGWQRFVREDTPLERIVATYRVAGDSR